MSSCHFHVATRSLSPVHLKQGSCRLPSIRHSDETCISCTLQLLIFVNVVWTMPEHARFQLKPERASEVQSYKNWETYDKTLLRPLLVFFLSLQPQRTEREWVSVVASIISEVFLKGIGLHYFIFNLNMFYKMFFKSATFFNVKLIVIWLICFILVDHVLHWYIHFSAFCWSSWICSS